MKKVSKPRVVIDTNILLSALILPDTTPNTVIRAWKDDSYTLLVTEAALSEFADTIRKKKFQDRYAHLERLGGVLLATLRTAAEIVDPIPTTALPLHSRDAKDDFLLAAAVGGNAEYLVTGDKDLLALHDHPALSNLRILTAREFLDALKIL